MENTTKADVMRYMKEKRLASGETTHNLIKELVNEGILKKKEINSQVHFLTVDQNLNYIYLQEKLLKSQIEKLILPIEHLLRSDEINIKMTRGKTNGSNPSGSYSTMITLEKREKKKKVKSNSKKQVTD